MLWFAQMYYRERKSYFQETESGIIQVLVLSVPVSVRRFSFQPAQADGGSPRAGVSRRNTFMPSEHFSVSGLKGPLRFVSF